MQIYSFYDRTAEEYSSPQIFRNDALAIRALHKSLQESPFPQDYWLYNIGTFYPFKGKIVVSDQCPVRVPFTYVKEGEIDG
jgi:hypothetical protein